MGEPARVAAPAAGPGLLEWSYRYGFTLLAGIVLLLVVVYYTHVLDERSYQNALQLEQVNAKLDALAPQLNRVELRLAGLER